MTVTYQLLGPLKPLDTFCWLFLGCSKCHLRQPIKLSVYKVASSNTVSDGASTKDRSLVEIILDGRFSTKSDSPGTRAFKSY